MNRIRLMVLWVLLAGGVFANLGGNGGVMSAALAQTDPPKAEAMRPEVSTPLSAADALIREAKYTDALAKIREAEAVPNRTPYEDFLIERLRGLAALGAGDVALATKSTEASIASGRLTPAEQLKSMSVLVGLYYRVQNYPKTIEVGTKYMSQGGTDARVPSLLIESYYATEDFANAAKLAKADVESEEKAGRTPEERRLQMLASSYFKQKDEAGYEYALEKLLRYYPKKQYWTDALRRIEKNPGFSERLLIDLLRLEQATGVISTAPQYTALAQLALQAGYPAEAKKTLDDGFAAGVLGTGPEADSQKQLRDKASKQAAEDEKMFARYAKDAGAAKDGTALFNVGYAMVSAGQFDKGLALMTQGIQKGGLKSPDDARLHLAIAYLAAGDKAKAVETFNTVQGADGASDLARLWLIQAQRSAS